MQRHTFSKAIGLLWVLLVGCTASAQKIEQFYDYNWKPSTPENARYYTVIEKRDSLWSREDFYVREGYAQMRGTYLDSANKVPHGTFFYFYPNKKLEMTGAYRNGKKEGVWLAFHENGLMRDSVFYRNGLLVGMGLHWHPNGMIRDSTIMNENGSGLVVRWFESGTPSEAGRFAAGVKKHGKWRYFHSNGQPSADEVYDNGVLVSRTYYDEAGSKLEDTTSHDQEARPVSAAEWKKYLAKAAYFPSHLQFTRSGEAVILVRFAVDENGNVVEPYITYSLHPDFDKIVYDAIKRAPKWLPEIDHNRKVKTYHTQPFTFAQTE